MHTFIKGVGLGIIAGAALTAAVVPVDRRKFMRSPVGKACKTVSSVAEDIRDAF
jgi:hypothetical protein